MTLYDPPRPPKRNSHGPVTYQCILRHCQITRLTFFFSSFCLTSLFFFYFFCLTSLFLQESVESLGLMVGARLLCFFPLIGQLSANPSKCPILSFQLSANPSKCSIVQFNFFSEMAFLQFWQLHLVSGGSGGKTYDWSLRILFQMFSYFELNFYRHWFRPTVSWTHSSMHSR